MPHRLLLADDSVTIQRVIELTFADEDIEVIAVGDGREAIRRIEADRPDIVLADIGMPEKDGYEVAAFVKNTPHLSHIPVLLLTGAFEPVDEHRAQQVGCDGVLAKPFEPQQVITRVNELLQAAARPRMVAPARPAVDPSAPPASLPAVSPTFDLVRNDVLQDAVASALPDAGTPPDAVTPLSPLDAFLADSPTPDLGSYEMRPDAFDSSLVIVPDQPTPSHDEIMMTASDVPTAAEAPTAAPVLGEPPADSSAVRISRRAPIAVPGLGAPVTAAPEAPAASSAAELDDYFEKLDAAFASLQRTPRVLEPSDSLPPVETSAVASGSEPQAREQTPAIAQAFSALLAAEHGEAVPDQAARSAVPATLTPEALDAIVERVVNEVVGRMSDRVVRDVVTDVVSRVAEKLVRDEIDRVKATIK